MGFNLRFFLAATILTAALTLVNINIWLPYINGLTLQTSMYIIQPAQLILSVFLPFAVMYVMSLKAPPGTRLQPILLSTFLGCLLGGLINIAIQFFAAIRLDGNSTTANPFLMIYALSLWIVNAAFPEILFVSIAAIMLAYYRAHRKIADS